MIQTGPMRTLLRRKPEDSRAARVASAVQRLGQDEQRLDRVKGRTYLVFANRAAADEVMQEITATPILADGLAWPVLMWDEGAGTGVGTFEAADGRIAVGHHWTRAERSWVAEYVQDWRAVEILDALPADWQPRKDDAPEPG